MTLRQLRYFLEIAQLRSFTRASEVLHIAQSALSRQVRALEEELGVDLFNRHERGVSLTEAGELLRVRAQRLLDSFDVLRDEIVARADEPRGALAVGLPPSLREMINVPLVCEYAARYPQVRLNVHEGISLDLGQLVQDGRLDCALVIGLEAPRATRAEYLFSEQLYLVGRDTAGLRPDRPVSLAEVAAQDLVLTTRPNSLRLIVENALANTHAPYRILADFNATGLMVELVSQGMAYSVLPYSAVWSAFERGRLALAPITGLRIDWALLLPNERGLSLPGTKLRELVLDIATRRIADGTWHGAALTAID